MDRSGNQPCDRLLIGEFVTIYRRGKFGKWTADFHIDGKHCRRSLKTATLRIARQRAAALDRQIAQGVSPTSSSAKPSTKVPNMTIKDAIEQYIAYCETEGCRAPTRTKYRGTLEIFETFATAQRVLHLHQISRSVIDKYRADRKPKISLPTLKNDGTTLKRLLDWAHARQHVAENVLEGVTFSAPAPGERGVLTLSQIDSIFAIASQRLQPILSMLAFTGMRSGEVERLLVEDVDLVGNWIKIESRVGKETKSGRSRKLPIHPRLRAVLLKMPRRKSGYFFTAEASKYFPAGDHHLNTKHLNEFFLKILKKLKIPSGRKDGFTIHSFRHFMRTSAINAGVPERVVDQWLGHASDRRAVQAIYYHLTDEASQEFMLKIPFGEGKPAADAGNKEVRNAHDSSTRIVSRGTAHGDYGQLFEPEPIGSTNRATPSPSRPERSSRG